MQSGASNGSVGSLLKFCSRQRKGLQVEAFHAWAKLGFPGPGWQCGQGDIEEEVPSGAAGTW